MILRNRSLMNWMQSNWIDHQDTAINNTIYQFLDLFVDSGFKEAYENVVEFVGHYNFENWTLALSPTYIVHNGTCYICCLRCLRTFQDLSHQFLIIKEVGDSLLSTAFPGYKLVVDLFEARFKRLCTPLSQDLSFCLEKCIPGDFTLLDVEGFPFNLH